MKNISYAKLIAFSKKNRPKRKTAKEYMINDGTLYGWSALNQKTMVPLHIVRPAKVINLP